MLPLFALALTFVLHWDAVVDPVWTVPLREAPLPFKWTVGVLVALALGLALILEELSRCLRATKSP
jgi:hypothetical protein